LSICPSTLYTRMPLSNQGELTLPHHVRMAAACLMMASSCSAPGSRDLRALIVPALAEACSSASRSTPLAFFLASQLVMDSLPTRTMFFRLLEFMVFLLWMCVSVAGCVGGEIDKPVLAFDHVVDELLLIDDDVDGVAGEGVVLQLEAGYLLTRGYDEAHVLAAIGERDDEAEHLL